MLTDIRISKINNKTPGTAALIKKGAVFLLDEATSMNKLSLEAIDRKMQEIRGNTNIMGNAVVLLSGDFRQTLPVIAREIL